MRRSLTLLGFLSGVACSGQTDLARSDAAPSCLQTKDTAVISAREDGIPVLGCDIRDAGRGDVRRWQRQGRIARVDATGFTLDACDADAGCSSGPIDVSVAAVGLDLRRVLATDLLVSVRGSTSLFFACTTGLVVESLPEWNGRTNPDPAESGFYLAASDGGADMPVRIENVRLDCPFEKEAFACNDPSVKTGLFELKVTPEEPNAVSTVLPMGVTRDVPFPSSVHGVRARNLRSFQTAACDDYWNWAVWIARERDRG